MQPYFIRSFFKQAFEHLGGELKTRESGRYEITFVPGSIRERDRQISGRDLRNTDPVLRKYERVCFEKPYVRLIDRVGAPMASLIHPAHPLMHATVDLVLEQHRNKLKQGTVLVDPNDRSVVPKLLFMIDHSVKESGQQQKDQQQNNSVQVISRRLQFVEIDAKGNTGNAGWAPHLDLQPIDSADHHWIEDVLSEAWISRDLESLALAHASTHLVPEHFAEVKGRRERQIDKNLNAIHERLIKEINYWSDRHEKLRADLAAGKDVRLTLENVRRTIDDLTARLASRSQELRVMRQVVSATPVVLGGALVIPAGLLAQRKGEQEGETWTADAEARARVERIALEAVTLAEHRLGHTTFDVSAEKCGWDITSVPPTTEGRLSQVRHIEVKGRAKGQSTITITRNEILYALNQADKFILAIVLVDGEQHEGPFYVRRPFSQEPDWAIASVNANLSELLKKSERPC